MGSGYGRDAEYIAGLGFHTVAFDISPTAVRAARRRYPGSPVRYVTADVLNLPAAWRGAFDLVVESMTVQSLPPRIRHGAIAKIGQTVAPGGTLTVIAVARDEGEPVDGPPWPLTRQEIDEFAAGPLRPVSIERIPDAAEPTLLRWRAESEHAR